jgi:hypothetical protein
VQGRVGDCSATSVAVQHCLRATGQGPRKGKPPGRRRQGGGAGKPAGPQGARLTRPAATRLRLRSRRPHPLVRQRSPRGPHRRRGAAARRPPEPPGTLERCERPRLARCAAGRRPSVRAGSRRGARPAGAALPLPRARASMRPHARPGWRNGRRAGLKILCPRGRVGSNPTPGTGGPSGQRVPGARCLSLARRLRRPGARGRGRRRPPRRAGDGGDDVTAPRARRARPGMG